MFITTNAKFKIFFANKSISENVPAENQRMLFRLHKILNLIQANATMMDLRHHRL